MGVSTQFHSYLLGFHILVAGLLVIELVVMTVVSRPRTEAPADSTLHVLSRLTRFATLQLALLLVTGVALMAAAGGLRGATGWLLGSLVLFVAAGALLGILRRITRAAAAAPLSGRDELLTRIRYATWAADGLVAVIATLMIVK